MKKMMSIFLLVVGIIGVNENITYAQKMEKQPQIKQELRMYVQDPGGS